jgi:hypothetical protein
MEKAEANEVKRKGKWATQKKFTYPTSAFLSKI